MSGNSHRKIVSGRSSVGDHSDLSSPKHYPQGKNQSTKKKQPTIYEKDLKTSSEFCFQILLKIVQAIQYLHLFRRHIGLILCISDFDK